jgi:aminopeptidase N
LDELNAALRNKLHHNMHARILQDVLTDKPGGLFVAFPKSKKYGRLLYAIDPFPGPLSVAMSPEEVILYVYDEEKWGVYYSSHRSQEYGPNAREVHHPSSVVRIEEQNLEVAIEKNGRLQATAVTSLTSQWDGLRVLPLELFHTLRVQSVTDAGGQPLSFIQEDKDKDPQFAIVLPRNLASGEKLTLRTDYGGPDAVKNEGEGNYYPVARSTWYPNTTFEDYATYAMRFSIPKGMQMVATGVRLTDGTEGNRNITTWKSEVPQTVAGFQFGKFKRKEKKLDGMDFEIEAYANQEVPDAIRGLQQEILGNMNTTGMMDKALAEAELAVRLYSDYFGLVPYKRLAVTQQSAPNYGQAWPELVWLPITYFFDATIRHQLGFDDPKGYFKVVEPHEVAHQWWGHTVTWPSYRDQWMSEGFAEFSASLFIQLIQKNNGEFIKFWNDERELLTQKNKEGFRAIDIGPLTQGYRLASGKTGWNVPRHLIYPKGAYVVHMIRMMMWNSQTGDADFKAMMHDFVKTYSNRPASTEDFKAMVEKHMTPGMDVNHNHTMDWFFDEYVYGTALPSYRLDYSFDQAGDQYGLNLKITQSGVDEKFTMLVPLYLELGNGRIMRLGAAAITGNRTIERKVPLAGLKEKPKRAMLNYFNDVLCTP